MTLREKLQHGWQSMYADVMARAESQSTTDGILEGTNLFATRRHVGENSPSADEEGFAGFGQTDAAAEPIEERDSKVVFE